MPANLQELFAAPHLVPSRSAFFHLRAASLTRSRRARPSFTYAPRTLRAMGPLHIAQSTRTIVRRYPCLMLARLHWEVSTATELPPWKVACRSLARLLSICPFV